MKEIHKLVQNIIPDTIAIVDILDKTLTGYARIASEHLLHDPLKAIGVLDAQDKVLSESFQGACEHMVEMELWVAAYANRILSVYCDPHLIRTAKLESIQHYFSLMMYHKELGRHG